MAFVASVAFVAFGFRCFRGFWLFATSPSLEECEVRGTATRCKTVLFSSRRFLWLLLVAFRFWWLLMTLAWLFVSSFTYGVNMPGCLPATTAPKSVYLSIYLSISICLFYLSFYLSVYSSISFFLSFCLSFFLSLWQLFCFLFLLLLFHLFALQRRNQTRASKQASKHELLTFGSGVLLGGALRPPSNSPEPPPAPRNLHFISDTRACHEINILR